MSDTAETTYTDGLPDDDALVANAFSRTQRRGRGRKEKQEQAPEPPPAAAPEPDAGETPAPEDVRGTAAEPLVQAAEPDQAGPEAEAAGVAVPEQREQETTTPEAPKAVRAEVAVRPAAPQPEPTSAPGLVHAVARPLPAPPAAAVGEGRTTQVTINVSSSVRDRFAAYQLAQKIERGVEPTNAVVVKRAVLHAHRNDLWGQMREHVRHRQAPAFEEDDDPDGLFGDVPTAGQAVRGRARDTVQQSFRPSLAELARYDQLAAEYGFDNRSEFLDVALEFYLPQAEAKRRR
ncbi:hypothetical protein [Actinacidiphila acididurans]|uniref:Uncharacterized protein n=1 Tax=Actinacidiphila acididurans TaxID=2784346 RepID=A0ABS2U345_9ACTN|nr:hypothetical protein [Actinacidiphila acididurans]MBM9510030.1 hypothetical protein [Actinacidiphila acididurans]